MFSFFQSKPVAVASPNWNDGEFDITNMDVFSIERTTDNRQTLIGFWGWQTVQQGHGGEDSVTRELHEWYLPVSPDKHAELLRRFRAKINMSPLTYFSLSASSNSTP